MLALASLLLIAPAQSSSVIDVLLRELGPVPGLGPTAEVRGINAPRPGRGGGWVAGVLSYDPAAGNSSTWVAVGQRPGQQGGPVQLLRQPTVVQGAAQTGIFSPSMANGLVAYVDRQWAPHRVCIEDQPIVASGDIIGGTAGGTWEFFQQVELTTSGDLLISGMATLPGIGSREILWRWPQEEVLLTQGQSLPGFGIISRFETYLSVSPNGQHWSHVVRRGPGLSFGLVVDGEILDAAPGRPVIVGSAVPPDIAGSFGPSLWDGLQFPAQVNDRGDWAFKGWILTLGGTYHTVIARNGRTFFDGNPLANLIGIDARGAVFSHTGASLLIEEQPVVTYPFEVDIDGDGVPDPGGGLCSLGSYDTAPPSVDGQTVFKSRLREMNQCTFDDVIVRARPMRIDVPICEGVPNSTGQPGQLIVGGTSRALENEVSLQLFGLPESAPCYALLSRSAGFAANPGGSQGNLCLGGGIGRMVLSLFVAGAEGRGQVTIDLTAMREPTGYVAAMPGERWYFQAWYRDSLSGTATSNFTAASAVLLN
ncbi:hypothetical protein Poly30_36930 [Planctomycetes bacterium Poly30]|uniref:Uncharacterized protein n=1 Tax=Saltatorellus ferox TaxID=2528018 RepID=A0A518EVP8_9BACT|nr:hypothetical protein Poly30_36930 [Planctomycetes bacterium Poly30]